MKNNDHQLRVVLVVTIVLFLLALTKLPEGFYL